MLKAAFTAILLFAAAYAQQLPAKPASTPAQIREAWKANFNEGKADAIVALYADDAVLVSEAGTFTDKASIRKWIQVSLDQGSKLESIDPDREEQSGDLAYGSGHSRRWVEKELHKGQYLIVMKKIGQEWKIVQHFSLNVR